MIYPCKFDENLLTISRDSVHESNCHDDTNLDANAKGIRIENIRSHSTLVEGI